MARKKVTVPPPNPQEQAAALEKLAQVYEERLNDKMGLLHNRFEAFISESGLPLTHALMVLEVLKAEIMDQAKKKYLGEG
jgi:hypothetical protein